jgi:hypothetical protein
VKSAPPVHNLRAVLQARGLRRLLTVRLISQLGDGWFQAGLAGSVLFNPDRRASPVAIAAGFAVLLLPYSLIGPYVGVFLDRWNRRSILFLANVVRAALIIPAAALIWSGSEGPLFLVVAVLITGINRLFLAGLSAALPHVVEDRRLVTANALSGTLGSVAAAAGLGSALVLLNSVVPATSHGYGVLASFAMLAYAGSALLARLSYSPTELGPDSLLRPHAGVWTEMIGDAHDMVAGLRHLAERRGAGYAMLAQSAHRVLFGVVSLTTILLYRGYLTSGDRGSMSVLAELLAAGGLGVLGAAFLTPPITRRIGGWRWVVGLLAFEGLMIFIVGLAERPQLLALGAFSINLASQGIKIVVDTDLQHECADEYRGRVFSVNDTAFNVSFVIGLFIAAFAVPGGGRSIGLMIGVFAGFLLAAAWYATVGGRWARRVGDDIAEPERSAALVSA